MVVYAEDVAIAKVHSESGPAFADYGFDYRCVGRDTRWFQMGVSFHCVSESLASIASTPRVFSFADPSARGSDLLPTESYDQQKQDPPATWPVSLSD